MDSSRLKIFARAAYEKTGRRIIDATLDEVCVVFAKVNYRQIFGVSQSVT